MSTLVLGVSLKPNRYSHYAVQRLVAHGVSVHAFGLKKGVVSGINIDIDLVSYHDIHTVTLYINAERQVDYYDYIISLKPKRVIFNPGTENLDFYKLLKRHNIFYEEACTLVLLSTNQY